MDDELDIPAAFEPVLARGVVNISDEVAASMPLRSAVVRINHHFQQSDLGYKPVSGDTFKLKVRGRTYPVFGSFSGLVHVFERIDEGVPGRRVYAIEGLLQFRLSVLWFLAVFSFFFLIVHFSNAGLWPGVLFTTLGTAVAVLCSYHAGRGQQDEVDERVHASLLRLRTTIQNLR